MRNKASLMNELRNSLVREHLRDGKPQEWAEAQATDDIKAHMYLLRKASVLRLAVRESRLQGL